MNDLPRKSFLERFQRVIEHVEDSILVGLLLLMIFMAVLQILLRDVFATGIVWSDVLVRILVLWVGLVGAMVASRQGRHINIDIMDRYLSERAKIVARFVVEFFTALICLIAAYYGLRFVQMEFSMGGRAFAKVPSWLCESIIPFAFMVMAVRYILLSVNNFKKIVESRS
ncbi:MAG: TRAP transporter small permease subunit [Desulfobacterales bacterium]|jgi:TRAP-type C4-dicarboxylate transport system permease small subunit|nr:TRAP transporter small permease subunit [Desulfobacterales bacterium]